MDENIRGGEQARDVVAPRQAMNDLAELVRGDPFVPPRGERSIADPMKAGGGNLRVDLLRDLEKEQGTFLRNHASHGEAEEMVGRKAEFPANRFPACFAAGRVGNRDAIGDHADARGVAEESGEIAAAAFRRGDEDAGEAAQRATRDEVADGGELRAEIRRVLGDVNHRERGQSAAARGFDEVESVLEILFVEMDDIGRQLTPLRGGAARGGGVAVARDRASAAVVGVGVVGADDLAEFREAHGEFVHARVR